MSGFIVKLTATVNRAGGEDSDRQFRDKARFDTALEAKVWIDTKFQEALSRARIGGLDMHVRVVRDEDYNQAFKDRFDAEP